MSSEKIRSLDMSLSDKVQETGSNKSIEQKDRTPNMEAVDAREHGQVLDLLDRVDGFVLKLNTLSRESGISEIGTDEVLGINREIQSVRADMYRLKQDFSRVLDEVLVSRPSLPPEFKAEIKRGGIQYFANGLVTSRIRGSLGFIQRNLPNVRKLLSLEKHELVTSFKEKRRLEDDIFLRKTELDNKIRKSLNDIETGLSTLFDEENVYKLTSEFVSSKKLEEELSNKLDELLDAIDEFLKEVNLHSNERAQLINVDSMKYPKVDDLRVVVSRWRDVLKN